MVGSIKVISGNKFDENLNMMKMAKMAKMMKLMKMAAVKNLTFLSVIFF